MVHGMTVNSSNVVMDIGPIAGRKYERSTSEVVVNRKKKLPKIFNVDKDMSLQRITRRTEAGQQNNIG